MNVSSRIASRLAVAAGAALIATAVPATEQAVVSLVGRPVPQPEQLPAGPYRDMVLRGQELVTRTFAHLGPEVADPGRRFAGNNLACSSCHQQGATKPFAMPLTGVASMFPQYRPREDEVGTMEERVNGCMQRSMNGRPLPVDSPDMKAFVTYIAFLAQGIAPGVRIEGLATPATKMPDRRANPEAGKVVYAGKCASCHGPDGQGVRAGKPGDALGYTFPPLWGPDSFNSGAGMNRLVMATRFIRHNMPLGVTHDTPQLSDDEAYDVAAYMVSQPRPVKANLEADFPARWNKPVDAAFPPYMLGAPADQHKYGPFAPLAAKQRELAPKLKAEAEAARKAAAPKPAAPPAGTSR